MCACLIALVVVGAHFDVSCPCDFLVTAGAPWMVLVSRCSAVLLELLPEDLDAPYEGCLYESSCGMLEVLVRRSW